MDYRNDVSISDIRVPRKERSHRNVPLLPVTRDRWQCQLSAVRVSKGPRYGWTSECLLGICISAVTVTIPALC